MEETEVIFRKFKDDGSLIALFPYEEWAEGSCGSYMHVGQHGGADYNHCIKASKPAKLSEYKDLKEELQSLGYVLKVIKRKQYATR